MVIKCLESHLNVFKRSNDPYNYPKFHITVVVVHVRRWKNFKTVRRSNLPFVIKHALFSLETANLLASCSDLWGMCVHTFGKHANFFSTSSWWHDIKWSKVSCFSCHFLFFFGIKMPWHVLHACAHALRPICLKIPTNLLHMELTRTHVHKNMIFQTVMVRRFILM